MPRISSAFATVSVSTPQSALPVDRDEIGQVVLALRVLRRDAAHRVEQAVEREGVDAGVDLADRAFRRASRPVLDDTCNLARRIGRSGRSRAGRRRRRSRPSPPRRSRRAVDERLQRVGRQQRHVAGQQDQRAGRAGAAPARPSAGRGRAELWLLDHESEARCAASADFSASA